ncbi:hypothetical protein CYY_006881 [Polysphondylium violaceum]|uniref:serine C-palmitoyltransferase n=1 Tax=Polysphondylium violaceum TaxID=133409 RepID=A0A8J4PR83_9MYCE|nr:hypothetical protein CYY_006881 [Polysphondylium violaceum]
MTGLESIYHTVFHYVKEYFLTSTSPNLAIHGMMLVFIVYLLSKRPFKPKEGEKLTKAEEDQLIREWTPLPLAPKLTRHEIINSNQHIITASTPTHSTVNDKQLLNLARSNYLGLIGNKGINEIAENTIKKYGVGSCGPRGFYGTIDVHLELEKKTAEFMKSPEAILYSSSYATISSAIPSFSKIGDILIVDKGICQPISVGVALSRSRIYYFEHNNMQDLERVLKETEFKSNDKQKLVRKFVVIEGLYYNFGDIPPLPKILELKEKYKFRLIMDESHSVGVLGKTGRGITEHYNIDVNSIDILTGSYGNAFSSGGGFCCGSPQVTYHQRLNGVGYVFSASLPPYLAQCAKAGISLLEENPNVLEKLHSNIKLYRQGLSNIKGVVLGGSDLSPIIHLYLDQSYKTLDERDDQEVILERVAEKAIDHGLLLTRAKYVEAEKFIPKPSIRICVNAELTKDLINDSVKGIKDSFNSVL